MDNTLNKKHCTVFFHNKAIIFAQRPRELIDTNMFMISAMIMSVLLLENSVDAFPHIEFRSLEYFSKFFLH